MDPRRARVQEWLIGALGAVLVTALFLPWYRACRGGECGSGATFSAWEAFAVVDLVLLVAGLVGLAVLVLTLAQRTPALPLALTSIGTFVALAAALLAVLRLAVAPGLGAGGDAEVARMIGAWLGPAAALGLVAAMLASVRDERMPVPPRSLEEQERAVRTLRLSSTGAGRNGERGREAAR